MRFCFHLIYIYIYRLKKWKNISRIGLEIFFEITNKQSEQIINGQLDIKLDSLWKKKLRQHWIASLAEAVEYTNCISADG